ncbi:hypothetical protein [Methylohalomonas lacus]|uniref:hypothetical protein n=1 Tax=Methylohalomonas lacus TaxID=398773 RepID=UPI00216AA8BB|nr:hypothetical protein [Methylohalomonas lacus]
MTSFYDELKQKEPDVWQTVEAPSLANMVMLPFWRFRKYYAFYPALKERATSRANEYIYPASLPVAYNRFHHVQPFIRAGWTNHLLDYLSRFVGASAGDGAICGVQFQATPLYLHTFRLKYTHTSKLVWVISYLLDSRLCGKAE